MKKGKNSMSYTAKELQVLRRQGKSRTDWNKVDAMTQQQLKRLIQDDPDERNLKPDWTQAKLMMPEPKEHINLRIDADVVRFFKNQGKGYQTRMNAVLRAYYETYKVEQSSRP